MDVKTLLAGLSGNAWSTFVACEFTVASGGLVYPGRTVGTTRARHQNLRTVPRFVVETPAPSRGLWVWQFMQCLEVFLTPT